MGKLRWRRNNDKWKISYYLEVQILMVENDHFFWQLTYEITRARSGKEPRTFQADDFDETEELINEMHRKLTIAFSSRKTEYNHPLNDEAK